MSELNESARDVEMMTKRIAELNRHMRDLESSYERGNTTATTYRAEKRDLEKQLRATSTEISRMGITARDSAGGLNNMGMRMLMVGQFADDMQYGFRSVVNNIPQMVMALGGSVGVAGALSVVAVGINQVINNWDKLESLWSRGGAETQAQRMKRLAEATQRTAQETTALARYQREGGVAQELGGTSDREQTAVADAINKIRNSQGGQADLVEKLVQKRIAAFGVRAFMTEQMDNRIAYERKHGTPESLAQWERVAITEATQLARDYFTKMLAALVNDPARRGELEKLVASVNPVLAQQLSPDVQAEAIARQDATDRLRGGGVSRASRGRPRDPNAPPGVMDRAPNLGDVANQVRRDRLEERNRWEQEAREDLRTSGRTLADRRNARQDAEFGDQADAMMGDRVMQLVNDPRFRRRVGAETRADAMMAAQELAHREMTQMAMLPKGAGGMGLDRDQASQFAARSLGRIVDPITDELNRSMREMPVTTKELAAVNRALLEQQRYMVRNGIPVVWSK